MCGITGIYGKLPVDDARRRITGMNAALAHRGPDARGIFVKNPIVLGHQRLSILDLSADANQPMTDPTGRYTLVFNGEIYNFRELRKGLSTYAFTTDGDTEVLLAGLIKWGIPFLQECNGMFAFAFWDAEREELILARDRMGIKPLYYARTAIHTIFGSEVRSLLKSGLIPASLNRNALGDYLRYQTVHAPATMLDGVFMLPAGNTLRINADEEELKGFWNMATAIEPGVGFLNYTDTKTLVREKLTKAVGRRLVSDVPMGAFLSGGIDSSAIVALASGLVSDPLKTFTISFQEEAFSEARFARIIADKYQTDHTELKLDPSEMLHSLPVAIAAMDHPSGDGINTFVVSRAAKEAGITVVLSGLGGDELFAGYPIFKQVLSLSSKGWLMSFPKFSRAFAGDLLQWARPGIASQKTKQVITEDYLDLEYAYQYSREVASHTINNELSPFGSASAKAVFDIVHEGVGYGTPGYAMPPLSRVTYAEMNTYMQSVLLRDSDQMGMAHALEIRVPFLDHELVSTALAIPDRHKFPTSPKKLLVESMGDLLPAEIVNRPKMGFTFPWDEWMKGELREFCGDQMLGLARHEAFHEKAVLKRWDHFLAGKREISWSRIWHLCILQAWMNENGIA